MTTSTTPRLLGILAALTVVVAACGGGATATPGGSATPSPTPSAPVELAIGLGYIPDVQFAPFYLADQAGYYRDAGLEVTFENKLDPDLITLVGQGALDLGIADGTSVIPAVSQGIPIRYVFTVYADFPSIVFAKASSGIAGPADLAGRKVGIPGRYGSSWIQLQALLAGVGLTPADLEIVPFPDFGQRAALEQGVVDAATGFVNNEPIRMELAGTPAVVLALPADAQLPGNGLIVGQAALDGPKAGAIRAFVAATRKAMEEITADPQKGLEAAFTRVPELAADRTAQLAVLEATIDTWQNDFTAANGLGAVDAVAWERSIAFMSGLPESPVAKPVTVADCIDATFAAP
ncbi:MAG TPA: ABC transporter substrate-binding protein [Candidatus Nanopelagicales bacterium]|nr:ABC transporter substrate-binding protein [Candidatus Nanopelagicales bacterium]